MSAFRHCRRLAVIIIAGLSVTASPAVAQAPASPPAPRQGPYIPSPGDFSPAFLGMYRKLMEIDAEIARYARQYGVDPLLARAVCMFESGANPDLTSFAIFPQRHAFKVWSNNPIERLS